MLNIMPVDSVLATSTVGICTQTMAPISGQRTPSFVALPSDGTDPAPKQIAMSAIPQVEREPTNGKAPQPAALAGGK